MKKYYDLIVSLIKTNKRYSGCEDILEDIVNEVYIQSELVLNDITNESVINSYLNKVINTSIIKVSRQAGIKTHGSSTVNMTIGNVSVGDTGTVEGNTETSSKESEVVEEEKEKIEQESVNEIEADIIQDEPDKNEESDEVIINNVSEDTEDAEIKKIESEVDKSLVEKMINGVKESDEDDEEIEKDELPQNIDTLDEDTETLPVEEASELEVDDITSEYLQDTDNLDAEGALLIDIEENPEIEIIEDNLPEIHFSNQLESAPAESEEDNTTNADQEELLIFNEPETTDNLLIENDIEELSDLIQEDSIMTEFSIFDETSDTLEPDENDLLILSTENDDENVIEAIEIDNVDFQEPSYEYFEYSPQEYKFDYNEISSDIQKLGTKHSDLNTSEVIKLKYQEKLSIDEIASKLGTTDTAVLGVLNELANIVKD